VTPNWYSKAVSYLRGDKDEGLFGLYLYHLILSDNDIQTVVNIGTARGHSAVCSAIALTEAGRNGEIHTVDIIPPAQPRNWHGSQPDSDPLKGNETSMKDLIGRFHDPSDNDVPIIFHTGESNDIIPSLDCSPDLVFHDAGHTYQIVKNDVEVSNTLSDSRPIHVFDDCYLFEDEWEYRLFATDFWYPYDMIPKIGGLLQRLRRFSVSKTRFPGVTEAVREIIGEEEWATIEIIRDSDHAPITTLFPE
jgi:hypothetical protein